MPEPNALEVLFPGPRRILLCALFHEPARWWALAELAGRAGLQPASLRPHIAALRRAGIVRERTESRRAWFQADPACPVFAELQSLVGKLGPTDVIRHYQPIFSINEEAWWLHQR